MENNSTLVQISTDYVFDRRGGRPYHEDAPTAPVNAYGRTKLAGERAVLDGVLEAGRAYVVRTAWPYGAHGPNFVRTMIRLAAERDTVEVVDDQHGQPTWTGDLAEQIIALALSDAAPGIYHGTNAGGTTWCGLAREVFTLLGCDPNRIRPATTDESSRPAPRPAYTVLGHGRWAEAGQVPMRQWRDALRVAGPTLR